jgi:predicted DNA-binding protein (MmcQ/YjbR family)
MTPEEIARLAMGLPEATEDQPFGPTVDVYKVGGKVFAIVSPERTPPSVALKCEPSLAMSCAMSTPPSSRATT